MHEIFIEAESFRTLGGWAVDQQSMQTLHSSYVLAHGLGVPVADAVTEFSVDVPGEYSVWALTRDWTAAWNASDSAGKFELSADDKAFSAVLGANGATWDWQLAGQRFFEKGTHTLALHDLTGFDGRCDAVYLSDCPEKPDAADVIRARLGRNEIRACDTVYDLIVVGGGVAGICMALAAFRSGVNALLIHDRGMLGGCNSSEVRVCMGGRINLAPYENLGNVVKEIAPVSGHPTIFDAAHYEDDRKRFAFDDGGYDKNIRFNKSVTGVEMDGKRLCAVICTDVLTGEKTKYKAKLFADCSGDAVLSRLAGAEVMYGREAQSVFGESLAPKEHQKLVMGHSIRWYTEKTDAPSDFPDIDWGLPFDDTTYLNVYNGDWEQETGFARDMADDIEYIRDYGLRAIYSNWSYQKNHCKNKADFACYRLKWASALGGKRESYRVVGDYVVTQRDIEEKIYHEDGTACLSWSIDMHFPEPDNAAAFGEAFRSFAYHRGIVSPYPVPYRCLYARDVENLFLGGRTVSTSHVAFSSVRVMRTLGMLGEVVGLAAGICREKACLPREVYTKYLPELQARMKKGVPIPCAFEGLTNAEEAYHFKDAGWFSLDHPENSERHDPAALQKLKRGIAALGLPHKYPLPKEFTEEDTEE